VCVIAGVDVFLGRNRCAVLYGGANKLDQIKELRAGAEIVVATPVRAVLRCYLSL